MQIVFILYKCIGGVNNEYQTKRKAGRGYGTSCKRTYCCFGTAGSGKTTVALLRAHHLANIPNGGKVLLVTFNGALVKYMRGLSNYQTQKLVVENYHTFARGYLNSRGKMPRRDGIADPDEKASYIEQALDYFYSNFALE